MLSCKYLEKSGCMYGENNPVGDGIEESRSSVRRLRLLSATPGCRMRSRRNRHCMHAFRPFKSDLTACQSEVRDAEDRDTTKTDRTLQEISCRDFASTAAAAPQVPGTIMSSSESDALRTSIEDPKLGGIFKLYIHGGKDGGKEQEEETGEDDGTLEEIGNRNEVDDVHPSKRVSTLPSSNCVVHVDSSVTLSSATHVRPAHFSRRTAPCLRSKAKPRPPQ